MLFMTVGKQVPPPTQLPAACLPDVEAVVAAHEQQWLGGGHPVGSACLPDEAILAAQLRPQVFEGIRAALDPVMRADLEKLQVCTVLANKPPSPKLWQFGKFKMAKSLRAGSRCYCPLFMEHLHPCW